MRGVTMKLCINGASSSATNRWHSMMDSSVGPLFVCHLICNRWWWRGRGSLTSTSKKPGLLGSCSFCLAPLCSSMMVQNSLQVPHSTYGLLGPRTSYGPFTAKSHLGICDITHQPPQVIKFLISLLYRFTEFLVLLARAVSCTSHDLWATYSLFVLEYHSQHPSLELQRERV